MYKIGILFLVILAGLGCSAGRSNLPNIIIISIDTLRADHLGCYGYERNTSPVLDSLAEAGTIYTRAQAQAPHTTPAHSSIWTGLSVISHGAGYHDGSDYGLDPDLPTIATMLKENGYITLGMVNVSILNNDFGFASGFDYYSWNPNGEARAGETVDEYLKWLDDNQGNPNPVFAMIHLYDVHLPFDPPAPYDLQFTENGSEGITNWESDPETGVLLTPEVTPHLIDLYDGEIQEISDRSDKEAKKLADITKATKERDAIIVRLQIHYKH